MLRRSFIFLTFAATPVLAHSITVGDIKIGHAWALPTSLLEGQAFMPLFNTSANPDSLIAARSERCALIELRAHNKYDILPMQEFHLETGKPLAMRPTARHLRLIGLRAPLVLGDKFPLVLDFLNAGEVEIEAHVETAPGD
jgi:periplasmic copper chaperone A